MSAETLQNACIDPEITPNVCQICQSHGLLLRLCVGHYPVTLRSRANPDVTERTMGRSGADRPGRGSSVRAPTLRDGAVRLERPVRRGWWFQRFNGIKQR